MIFVIVLALCQRAWIRALSILFRSNIFFPISLIVGWAYKMFNVDEIFYCASIRFAPNKNSTLFIQLHVICSFFVYKLKTITVSCNTKYCATQHSVLVDFCCCFRRSSSGCLSVSPLHFGRTLLRRDYYWLIKSDTQLIRCAWLNASILILITIYASSLVIHFEKSVENLFNRFFCCCWPGVRFVLGCLYLLVNLRLRLKCDAGCSLSFVFYMKQLLVFFPGEETKRFDKRFIFRGRLSFFSNNLLSLSRTYGRVIDRSSGKTSFQF